MTQAFEYLTSGEFFQAVAEPFVSVIGWNMFLFLVLSGFCILLYFKTESAVIPTMFFIVSASGVQLSHLFANTTHKVAPPLFDVWIFLVLVGALTFVFLRAIFGGR